DLKNTNRVVRIALLVSLIGLTTVSRGAEEKGAGLSQIPRGGDGSVSRVVASRAGHGLGRPVSLTFDSSGALLVVESPLGDGNRAGFVDEPEAVLADLGVQSISDRDAWMVKYSPLLEGAAGPAGPAGGRVRRLEGRTGKGVFRQSTIFAGDLGRFPSGVASGIMAWDDVVYVGGISKVYGFSDGDGDGMADQVGEFVDGLGWRFSSTGWSVSGFEIGPDGRIYGATSDRGMKFTTMEGAEISYLNEGVVFRFEPDGTGFEVLHRGLRNPRALFFDSRGDPYVFDGGGEGEEARFVAVVPGGDSGWRMGFGVVDEFFEVLGFHEKPMNPWLAERRGEQRNEQQPAYMIPPVATLELSPRGAVMHPGVGFLEREAGRLFVADGRTKEGGIWSVDVELDDVTVRLDGIRRLTSPFVANDVAYSWEGKVYAAVGADEPSIVEFAAENVGSDPTVEEVGRLMAEGFAHRGRVDLVELMRHPDRRVRLRAHLAMTRKANAVDTLADLLQTSSGRVERLHALWGLGVIARRGAAALPKAGRDEFVEMPDRRFSETAWRALLPLLDDEDAEVRAQAIKVLGDSGIVGDRIKFGALFRDPSKRVRGLAARAAGQTKAYGSLTYLWELLIREGDDPQIRQAGVFALAEICKPMQLQVLRSHENRSLRMAAMLALARKGHAGIHWFAGDPDFELQQEWIRVIYDFDIEGAREPMAAFLEDEESREWTEVNWWRLLHSAFRLGDEKNLLRVMKVAFDPSVPVGVRGEALRLLANWSDPGPIDILSGCAVAWNSRNPTWLRKAVEERKEELLALPPALEEAVARLIRVVEGGEVED
ncbi:MAG: HEAT repeat domain-containing protein, partial [Verrucomicrobiales bacterium]